MVKNFSCSLNSLESDSLHEKCGVFGVYGKDVEAARLVYYGLWALQHRGQESSGIASANENLISVFKGEGLVSHVYTESSLSLLKGSVAIGHNRYSTSGGSCAKHIQPIYEEGSLFALAHNGNLPIVTNLQNFLISKGINPNGSNDSELMYKILNYYVVKGYSLEDAVKKCFPMFIGSFCLILMSENKLIAVRDSYGIRPLCIGKLNNEGYVFSSESCALDIINAEYVREVNPGEMVVVDKNGLKSFELAKGTQKLDIFEFVYFARPDSILLGKRVNEVRKSLGRILAKEARVKGDVIIPVPDSSIPASFGYSQQAKIPVDFGLIKNRYVHRTFIKPAQSLRDLGVKMKLNTIPEIFKGKEVLVIDDSIVRGTTSKKIVELVKNAGARKVHMLISSPPVRYPDFYGIDTPDQNELIAANMSVEEIRNYIEADSLHFLSYKGLIEATGLSENLFTTTHFTGIYPIDIGERNDINIRKNFVKISV